MLYEVITMAFSAGFLHYYLNGKPIDDALRFGNAAGALNTTKRGATVITSYSIHYTKLYDAEKLFQNKKGAVVAIEPVV